MSLEERALYETTTCVLSIFPDISLFCLHRRSRSCHEDFLILFRGVVVPYFEGVD
jgi:hypothetical protein